MVLYGLFRRNRGGGLFLRQFSQLILEFAKLLVLDDEGFHRSGFNGEVEKGAFHNTIRCRVEI